MSANSPEEVYLVDYLKEEFRRRPEIRVRQMTHEGEEGVMVRTDAREYFFPFAWMRGGRFSEVIDQVRKIKRALPGEIEP